LNETLSRSKTFHVVEWVRARAPLEVYQRPSGGVPARLRTADSDFKTCPHQYDENSKRILIVSCFRVQVAKLVRWVLNTHEGDAASRIVCKTRTRQWTRAVHKVRAWRILIVTLAEDAVTKNDPEDRFGMPDKRRNLF